MVAMSSVRALMAAMRSAAEGSAMIGARETDAAEEGDGGAAESSWAAAEEEREERVGEDRRDRDTRLSRAL
jgi:hypothetical protein